MVISKTAIKISCRNLWKVYGPTAQRSFIQKASTTELNKGLEKLVAHEAHVGAVCNVSFDIHEGEIFVIMGLSGSGKSTIVRCLSRLVEPTAGKVLFDGKDLLKASGSEMIEIRRHKMGMVFQNFGLKPEIWFLDEPFSSLDPLIRSQMQEEFVRLQKLLNKTIVFITHDFLEAIKLADRIAIMKEGRIVQIGTPADVVMKPVDSYVTKFTKDVPRVKIIRAKDCMETSRLSDISKDSIKVKSDATLEEIIHKLANTKKECCVLNSEGKIIGRISAETVVDALAAGDSR